MSLSADSRYAKAGLIRDIATGQTWVATRVPISLAKASDDRYVKPRAGERPDAFSYRVWSASFGDDAAKLWWIVCDLNDIVNPLAPLDPDVALRCPSADRLVLEVFG